MDAQFVEVSPRSHRDAQVTLRDYLKEYYGRILTGTQDLERKACCADSTLSQFPEIAALIPAEVKERNFGCGCSIPGDELRGLTVLDLGCGAGLDCFLMSHLVGPDGVVHGIDMTDEQLAVARRFLPEVTRNFGYSEPNVHFHKGYIETADAIRDRSVDIVISD
jgi:SAM-dependent methyltransferase